MVGPGVFVFGTTGTLSSLSNYWECSFRLENLIWPTVEHYFQAAKFSCPRDRETIRQTSSAEQAKLLAWHQLSEKIRPDWSEIRYSVMRTAIAAKSDQCREMRLHLWETWPYPIFEDSLKDGVWGIGIDGSGENLLGRCLQDVRRDLINVESEPVRSSFVNRPAHHMASRYGTVVYEKFEIASQEQNWLDRLMVTPLVSLGVDTLIIVRLEHMRVSVRDKREIRNAESFTDIVSSLVRDNPELSYSDLERRLFSARADAFDEKYCDYHWEDDARALYPNWVERFFTQFGDLFESKVADGVLVTGAGSGDEALHLWSKLGRHVTLVDVGSRLVANCASQAPLARCIIGDAEDLRNCSANSYGLYCSLRTFQSFSFDLVRAIREARRVLRDDGVIVISLSDAYVGKSGEMLRGRLVADGNVDLASSLREMQQISICLLENGFAQLEFASLGTEVVIWGYVRANFGSA